LPFCFKHSEKQAIERGTIRWATKKKKKVEGRQSTQGKGRKELWREGDPEDSKVQKLMVKNNARLATAKKVLKNIVEGKARRKGTKKQRAAETAPIQ